MNRLWIIIAGALIGLSIAITGAVLIQTYLPTVAPNGIPLPHMSPLG